MGMAAMGAPYDIWLQSVSKEKKFENVNLSDLGPRSMNDLDLWYTYRFMYLFSYLHLPTLTS